MVVEAQAEEAFKIAAERDVYHVRRDPLDTLDLELTSTRLVTHFARGAGYGK